ncbi:MAG: 3-isopropylmalate dehydrogenase [Patescibacteria group bacterium]
MYKNILVLPGDGIGPEVTAETVKMLKAVAEKFGHDFHFRHELIGAAAIDATGDPLPPKTIEAAKDTDAILLGAVGLPKYDQDPHATVRPEQGLLKIRKDFDLFANIRPIRLFSPLLDASSLKQEVLEGADIVFFRELVGGIYFGEPRGRNVARDEAWDTMRYTKDAVVRIARMAFEAARRRKKTLRSVDKANVLECSRLWRETVNEVARDYSDVALTHMYVDNAAMQLIKNPRQFDVVLTENMFGDILTDEASQIAGSLGLLASASLGPGVGLFEPIHGSAPDIAGKGIANPIASILSGAMLLEYAFGLKTESDAVWRAVSSVLESGYRTFDIKDTTTTDDKIVGTKTMGDLIVSQFPRISV